MTGPSEQGHERWRDDLAAYALGALAEPDAAELEEHLDGCEPCRERLRWLEPAVDLLPRSVGQLQPPSGLRERLLEVVRAEARESLPAAGDQPAERRRARLARVWRPATAVAAGAILVAGGAAGYLLHDRGDSGGSGSVVAAERSAGAPAALAARVDREGDAAILHVSGLPPAPRREVYEAWVRHQGQTRPASLFSPRRDRTADAAIPGPLSAADVVLVTREPRGGSPQPTSAPLLRATLR